MLATTGIPLVTVPEGNAGPWRVERFTVEANSPGMLYLSLKGRGIAPGTYTRLLHDRRGVVMSDTPAEMRDHQQFVWKAKGHCLINGLGIGMCVAAILQKPEVEKITVVEIDAHIVSLVGPHYASDPRVEIVNADAFEYRPPKGVRYGAVWHDIWDSICADNLPEMHRLHRKYGRRADWQGSWCRYECERSIR
jgi:Spermidine synthase